jgi:hypothetical protein
MLNNYTRNAFSQSFIGFNIIVLLTLLQFTDKVSGSIIPFLLICILSTFQLSKTVNFGWERLHEQMFWLFNFVWLGLAPLVQQLSGKRPLPFEVTSSDYSSAGWLVFFSLIAYSIVIEIRFKQFAKKPVSDPKALIRKLILFARVASLISILIIIWIGPIAFIQSREDFNKALFQQGRADNSQGAILAALCCVPIFVCMIALQIQLKFRYQMGTHRKLQNTFKWILVLNLFVNNPISQGRFWFCTVWGSFFLVRIWGKSRMVAHFPIIGVLFVLLIFPISDVFRYSSTSGNLKLSTPISMLETKGDFDSFEQIAWGMKYVQEVGHTNGSQILGAVVFAVPRAIWPDKPRDTGIILGKAANFGNLSLSAPIWIEGYIDGGLILMCLYMLFFAYAHSRFREMSRNNPSFSIIFIPYQLVVLRGSLIASMGFTAILLISIWILRHYGSMKNEV